jgi:hypothetical protein
MPQGLTTVHEGRRWDRSGVIPPLAPSSETGRPELLRSALDLEGVGVWELDPTAGTLVLDDTCRGLLAMPPSAPGGWESFLSHVHVEDRGRLREAAGRRTEAAHPEDYADAIRCAGDPARWIAVRARARGEGAAARVLGTMRDGSQRKRDDDAHQGTNEEGEKEMAALERLSAPAASTSVTAELFGVVPLEERAPTQYWSLVERYAKLLDASLERQVFKGGGDDLTGELRAIADQLGAIRASAREVAQLHARALGRKMRGMSPQKTQALIAEGRLLAFELMGYLLSFYRRRSP